ncbi:hypothetical protein B0H11DRAFT_2010102, partial [Mycena galericulata]
MQPEPSTSQLPSRSAFSAFAFPATATPPPPPANTQDDDADDAPSDQPSVAALAALGIKVRDFFYESTLPPIAPFRRAPPAPVRQQVQPGGASLSGAGTDPPGGIGGARPPRPLKRTRRDGTEEADLGYGFVMGVARARPEKVRRLGTETAGPRVVRRREREGALLSLDEEAALRTAAWDVFGGGGDSQGTSQSQGYSQSQSQSQGHSQSQGYSQDYYSQSQSQSQGNSQEPDTDTEPEPLIATPLVTPNGSLQWVDGDPRVGSRCISDDSPPLVPTEPASVQTSTARVRSPPPPRPGLTRDGGSPSPHRIDALPASPTPPPKLGRTFSALSTLSSPLSEAPSSSALGAAGSVVLSAPTSPAPAP